MIVMPDTAQDAWEREVAIVTAQMDMAPYNEPPGKLEKAAALCRACQVTHVALDTYRVVGTHGTYTVAHNVCGCPDSTLRKTKHCKHATAVQIYQRCLAGGAQPPGGNMATEPVPVLSVATVPDAEVQTAKPDPRTVYQAMNEVAAGLARIGVAKARTNPQNKSPFRSTDDIQNAVAPLLVEAGLLIVPLVESVDITERASSTGGTLRFALAKVTYAFVECTTGDSYGTTVYGEAMDSGDRAFQKAMTFAYKQLLIQTFCIPVEGQEVGEAVGEVPRQGMQRPVPHMTQGAPAPDYRELITQHMRSTGKGDAPIRDYWHQIEKRYPKDLDKRLPGIWKALSTDKGDESW